MKEDGQILLIMLFEIMEPMPLTRELNDTGRRPLGSTGLSL